MAGFEVAIHGRFWGGHRGSYQDFFAAWKDADPDLPVLVEAKQEYAKLAAN